MSEHALLQAFKEIIYGHLELSVEDEEVAIEKRAWLMAADHVDANYPLLADIMRRVQAKDYLYSREAEDKLERDLGDLDDLEELGDSGRAIEP